MKASDAFVKALENEGVEYIFGIPGEENLDFLNSLKESSIKMIVTRHEQAAGFMAATVGRLTGKTGVCLSTLGPGATNFATSAAYAQLGAMPMLMLTGQKPIRKSKQGRFQIVDIVGMMKPLTNYTVQITEEDQIPGSVREAIKAAESERPGAAHIELPEDIAAGECKAALEEVTEISNEKASEEAIQAAIDKIKNAKSPLLLIGAATNRHSICKAFKEFVDTSGIYFFNTQMGKGVIDERHKQFLGTAALSSEDHVHCAVEKADLVICVGHDPIEKPPFIMTEDGPELIHINSFSVEHDRVYFPQSEVIGPICDSIYRISEGLKSHQGWDFSYFKKVKKELEEKIAEKSTDKSFPLIPQRIVADLRKVIPEDGILTLDNGMYKIWFARNYKAYEANTLLLDNALATMGAGLPSAIAAKIIHPERKVVTVCGDGGFMMNSQELETALRLGLDLVVIVLRDNAYGMIKWKQSNMDFEDYSLDIDNPDFVQYAESYGAKGWRVEKLEDFEEITRKCLNEKGVHVIEVPIDYSENSILSPNYLKSQSCPV